MRITWNGHACFTIESDNYRLVFDPYTLEVYPPLSLKAHAALCSHGHRDHCHTDAITFESKRESPFTVETLSVFHDDQQGALRGSNTIHIVRGEGMCVVHLGDLGHALSEEQLAAIRGCDLLLIPVGGFYTIDAPTAKALMDAAAPRVTVPMHYRHGEFGLRPVAELSDFLALVSEATMLESNSFTLTPDSPAGIVVPKFIP